MGHGALRRYDVYGGKLIGHSITTDTGCRVWCPPSCSYYGLRAMHATEGCTTRSQEGASQGFYHLHLQRQ
eukprot:9346233-Pyramimonas_sp.AAC.1